MPELILVGSSNGLRLLRGSEKYRAQRSLLGECSMPAETWHSAAALGQQLRTLLALPQATQVTAGELAVVLPDLTTRLFMVTPPRNAGSLADCAAAAGQRFQEIYGEAPHDWQLAADWDARRPFLACAVPRPLLAAVYAAAQERHCAVTSVVPYFVAAWNRWHAEIAEPAWFATLHDNRLTLAALAEQRLCAVRSLAVPAEALQDQAWLPRQLERESLRLGLPMPSRLKLCGEMPPQSPWRRIASPTLHCEVLAAEFALSSAGGGQP